MTDYSEKICEACQPDADPATNNQLSQFLSNNSEWCLTENDHVKKIERTYKFNNFVFIPLLFIEEIKTGKRFEFKNNKCG